MRVPPPLIVIVQQRSSLGHGCVWPAGAACTALLPLQVVQQSGIRAWRVDRVAVGGNGRERMVMRDEWRYVEAASVGNGVECCEVLAAGVVWW